MGLAFTGPPDLHAPDQAILDQENVLNNSIINDVPFQIAHYLVSRHEHAPIGPDSEADWFNKWIDGQAVTRPVIAKLQLAAQLASFPTVLADHIRVHYIEDSINIAGVESAVGAYQKVLIC